MRRQLNCRHCQGYGQKKRTCLLAHTLMFNNQSAASPRLASFESNGIFPNTEEKEKDLSFCLDLIIESRRVIIYTPTLSTATAFHFLLYDWQTEVLKYSHTIKRNAELRRKQYTIIQLTPTCRVTQFLQCAISILYCILGHMSNSPISTRTRRPEWASIFHYIHLCSR